MKQRFWFPFFGVATKALVESEPTGWGHSFRKSASLDFSSARDERNAMSSYTVDQAQKHLPELILSLANEGEVLIVGTDGPVAKLSPIAPHPVNTSLRDLQSSSVGRLLRPYPSPEDDIFGEMISADS